MAATKATREVSVATPESSRSWKTVLREQGNRLTPQREVVLQAVEQLGHATADDVQRTVSDQAHTPNLSTIYRTLALLEDLGVIQHVNLADRTTVYHSKAIPAHVHLASLRTRQTPNPTTSLPSPSASSAATGSTPTSIASWSTAPAATAGRHDGHRPKRTRHCHGSVDQCRDSEGNGEIQQHPPEEDGHTEWNDRHPGRGHGEVTRAAAE